MKPFPRSGLPGVQPPVGPSETTTSIGRRCKRGDTLSRAVLIAREAFPLFQRFSSRCVCSPDPSASALELVASIIAQEFVSAVLERGSYPFPFRTRKSSLPSPMVPGPRARESRAPLDSRPLDGKPSRGLFFYTVPPCGSQPHELTLRGPFFFYTARHNPAGFFCARVSSRTSWDCRVFLYC